MHAQLTSLLAASEASGGGLSAAQAAAELAGVPTAGSGSLHAQQSYLAEARCRERFERRALEEFIRHSLTNDLPAAPPAVPPRPSRRRDAAAGSEEDDEAIDWLEEV